MSIVVLAGCVWWASKRSAPALWAGVVGWSGALLALGVYAVASPIRGWRCDRGA